jgi:hypothetical protein
MNFSGTPLESLPLGAIFAAVAAFACYRTVVAQSRGRSLRLWQLSIAPALGVLAAGTMLVRASVATPCLAAWVLVLAVGFTIGIVAGQSASLQIDYICRLIRVDWGLETVLSALMILLAALTVSALSASQLSILEWACVAAIVAGLCAGLLGGKAWRLFLAAFRSPDTRLSDL